MSWVPRAFGGNGSGATLKGVSVRQFANDVLRGAIDTRDAPNSRLSVLDADVSHNHGTAFNLGPNCKVLRTTITRNGFAAFRGGKAANLEVGFSPDIAFNGEGGWNESYMKGDIALGRQAIWVHHSHIHHCRASGIVFECGSRFWRAEDNSIHDCGYQGIEIDASYEGLILRNTVNVTGTNRSNADGYGACILVASSGASGPTFVLSPAWTAIGGTRAILIAQNTVGPVGGNFIALVQQPRFTGQCSDAFGPHVASGIVVDDNDIAMTGIGKSGFWNGTTDTAVDLAMWKRNRYKTPGATGSFWSIDGQSSTFAQWKAAPNRDSDSTLAEL